MSNFLRLNAEDFLKGLAVTILSAVITFLYQIVNSQGLMGIDWMELVKVAILATLGYLSKNLLTNSDGQIGREN